MKYLLLLPLFACSTASSLSAEDELTLSATTGGEEAVSGGTMSPMAIPTSERPDPFRACDAEGGFEALFDRYDADGDGRLDRPEEEEVTGSRGRGPDEEQMVMAQWALLVTIYDTDGDGAISTTERADLLSDFTTRCESLQARLLAEYDTDGDGVLSDSEEETARAAIEAEMEAMRADHPEGGPPEPPEGGPPEAGTAPPVPPPLLDEFDTDGDGSLSDAERTTLRDTMRARIRDGEPLCGM